MDHSAHHRISTIVYTIRSLPCQPFRQDGSLVCLNYSFRQLNGQKLIYTSLKRLSTSSCGFIAPQTFLSTWLTALYYGLSMKSLNGESKFSQQQAGEFTSKIPY